MVVKRIEHPKDGKGPFTHGQGGLCLDASEMPMPHADGVGYHPTHYVYGFYPPAYTEWVTDKDRQKLAEAGFMLRTYELNHPAHYRCGGMQVVFDKAMARLLSEEPLINC